MAEEFQTSFIPKKTEEVGSRRRKSSMGILTLGGIVIFLIAILASGAIFAYQKILERSIVTKKEELVRAQEAFEPSLIQELVRLDTRIAAAETLLDQHIAPSFVLQLLQDITLETVQFDGFTLTVPDNADGDIELSMEGRAVGFSAVALQSDEFAKSPYLKDPLFSGLAVTQTGGVLFSVSAVISPELLRYEPLSVAVPPDETETVAEPDDSLLDGVEEHSADEGGEGSESDEDLDIEQSITP